MGPCFVHEFGVFRGHAAELAGFGVGIPGAVFEDGWLEEFLAEMFYCGGGEKGEGL